MTGNPIFYYGMRAVLVTLLATADPITPEEALVYVGSPDITFLDVREPSEYEAGHIPGALLMSWFGGGLEENWQDLPTDKTIVGLLQIRLAVALGDQFLAGSGFDANLEYDGRL